MDYISFTERSRSKEWNMIKLESHPYFEIYFIVEGERTIIVRDKLLTVNKASAIIIPPFTPHRTEGGPYRRINAYVFPQSLDDDSLAFLHKNQAPVLFTFTAKQQEIIYTLLRSACSFENDISSHAFEYKKSFFYSILFYLKQCATVNSDSPRPRKSDIQSKNEQHLLTLVAYLNEHWNEKITIAFLCKKFFFTKTNLCNSFQKIMDCSIMEYLMFIRFEKAKEMLFNSNMNIQRIADECGFSSLNYFSLMFKKRIGISPSAYRKTR